MKNRLFNIALILAMVGVVFASCKKEYPQPPIQDLPIGTVYTIDEILAMETGTVFDTASVYGIVTADEVSGNLYKAAYMQDRATGAAIQLYLDAVSGLRIGDSIRVYLKDVKYDKYKNLPQLSGFGPDGHIVILANNKAIEPTVTTIANINAGQHLAQLVKLENVSFVDQQGTFAPSSEYGERFIQDATGATVMVRTSNYANFAGNPLPTGTGSLVAIASVYNTTWQLTVRSASELRFDGSNPGGMGGNPGEVQPLPYSQLFSSGFGTYMSYSVIDDDHVWKIENSYNAVVMTGHVQNGEQHSYYENEDWLISSPVDLTGVSEAKLVMNYIGRYFDDINNDVTLWASDNYVYGNDPTTAQWTQLPANLTTSSSWSDIKTAEVSLTPYVGQKPTVAVKYTSNNSNAGTMEVMGIVIEEGSAGGNPTPSTCEGDGTRENPFTANDIILLAKQDSDGNAYWVKDYIVGTISTEGNENTYVFAAEADISTNIILSSNIGTSNDEECVPVQLPAGVVREGLNLVSHPENYKQEVLLYATLEKYFSKPGIKNVSYAELNGVSLGTDPDGGSVVTDDYLNETLTTQASFNTFATYSVAGEQEWHFDSSHSNYGAQMSGYADNVSHANEDWFISPAIDLSGSTNPVLSFDHARGPANSINVGVAEGYYTVWVTDDYSGGNPNQDRWTELTGVNHGTSAWGFVSSGNLVIPEQYKTATCRIAFKYLSVSGASATWEVKNVVVKEQ